VEPISHTRPKGRRLSSAGSQMAPSEFGELIENAQSLS
jgi:hypothetical protein